MCFFSFSLKQNDSAVYQKKIITKKKSFSSFFLPVFIPTTETGQLVVAKKSFLFCWTSFFFPFCLHFNCPLGIYLNRTPVQKINNEYLLILSSFSYFFFFLLPLPIIPLFRTQHPPPGILLIFFFFLQVKIPNWYALSFTEYFTTLQLHLQKFDCLAKLYNHIKQIHTTTHQKV